jgi:Tol biopolymer transport system component
MNRLCIRQILWLMVILASIVLASCDADRCGPCNSGEPIEYPPVHDGWPRWSPCDSMKIAYTHVSRTWEEYQTLGLYSTWVVDVGTLETEHIGEGVVRDWSPDGQKLLIGREPDQLWLVDLATEEEDLLPIQGVEPDFAPTGNKIALYAGEETTGIWIYFLETMEAQWIANRHFSEWSPDGTMLLTDSLVIMAEDGTRIGKTEIDLEYGLAALPRWSPGGDRIAYGAYCEPSDVKYRNAGIWVANLDGTDQRLVVCPGAVVSWSPDGHRVAYGAPSVDSTAGVIWTTNVDGSERRQITFP